MVGGGIVVFGDVLLRRLELLRSRGFPDSAEGVLRRKWEGNGAKGTKAKNGPGLRSCQASPPWGTLGHRPPLRPGSGFCPWSVVGTWHPHPRAGLGPSPRNLHVRSPVT